jgi:hydroxymethylpyrimidine/phosphomethylpyrimidine kinase
MENAHPAPRVYRRVLTIAGSDSGGGAGIQADLKTFAALGCYGMSAITALTAQNTVGVSGIHPVPPDFAAAQIAAVLEDIGADAVKIGMLYSAELIRVVAEQLQTFNARNIVLDPVMVAQSGDRLLRDDAVGAITEYLMPIADVVTPNIPEAEVLVGREIRSVEEMRQAARDLGRFGSRSILVKGGHREEDDSSDLLYVCREDRLVSLTAERVSSRNTHGTGCTLSAAIAACLAKGEALEDAVHHAKEYISRAIRAGAGYTLGRGHGPVHHFFKYWV